MNLSNVPTIPSPQAENWLDASECQYLHTETPEEYKARRAIYFAKIASKYTADTVIVGQASEVWEDYVNNRMYATLEYPHETAEFKGVCRVECYVALQTPAEVVNFTMNIYVGRVLVVDKTSKQILAAHSILY